MVFWHFYSQKDFFREDAEAEMKLLFFKDFGGCRLNSTAAVSTTMKKKLNYSSLQNAVKHGGILKLVNSSFIGIDKSLSSVCDFGNYGSILGSTGSKLHSEERQHRDGSERIIFPPSCIQIGKKYDSFLLCPT